MSYDKNGDDEQRLCPTCRMMVSVWATKCHHCGEELGRPRREESKLTLKDLGGSQHTPYVPSGNVTGALESFRADEAAAEISRAAQPKIGFWGRLLGKKPPSPPTKKPSLENLPELDEYGENLAASILDDMPLSSSSSISRAQLPGKPSPTIGERLLKLAGVLVAIVVLYLGGSFAWTHTNVWLAARNNSDEVLYINKAPEMLARGDLTIDAFEEAVKAVGINDNEANRKIEAELRTRLLEEIDALMSRNPWKRSDYSKAAAYIQRAAYISDHPAIAAKFREINEDVAAYKFVLKSIDSTATKATFRLNNPKYEAEVIVEVADRLMDRFIIQRISAREVDLSDDKVPGRKLRIRPNEGVQPR